MTDDVALRIQDLEVAYGGSVLALHGVSLRVQRGAMSGQLDVRFGRVPGAGSYETQVAQGDPSVEANWRTALTSTLCTGVLSDLPPLQPCWVRVRALVGQNFGPWSELAGTVVL